MCLCVGRADLLPRKRTERRAGSGSATASVTQSTCVQGHRGVSRESGRVCSVASVASLQPGDRSSAITRQSISPSNRTPVHHAPFLRCWPPPLPPARQHPLPPSCPRFLCTDRLSRTRSMLMYTKTAASLAARVGIAGSRGTERPVISLPGVPSARR